MPDRETDRDAYIRRMTWRRRAARLQTTISRRLPGTADDLSWHDEVQERTLPNDRDLVTYYYAWHNDHLPDLDDPEWMNEKIRWLFLHHPNPLMSLCADKLTVRDYLALKGARIKPPAIHHVLDDPRQILDIDLPERFVFKPTFSSQRVHVEDGTRRTPRAELLAKAQAWSQKTLWRSTGELHYRGLPERWIVEEYLPGERERNEYRFACFMGEPRIVSVVLERIDGKPRRVALDMNWERMALGSRERPNDAPIPPKPDNFEAMREEATRLAEDFLHVRVDFLRHDGRTAFSELTFASGGAAKPFEPVETNAILGALIDLDQADAYLAHGRRLAAAVREMPTRRAAA